MKFLLFFLTSPLFAASFTGVINPLHDVEISFPLEGVVQNIFVKEGDSVVPSQLLMQLDNKLQELETQRRLVGVEDNSRLDASRKEESIVKTMYESARELVKGGSISDDEFKRLEIRYFTAMFGTKGMIEAKKKEKLEYEISKEVFDRYTLKSPIAGIVYKIVPEVGEWAKSGEAMIRIMDPSVCIVDLNIPASTIFSLHTGDLVTLITGENNEIKKEGQIIFISPGADQASGLALVKARFDNSDKKIMPGMTAQVTVKTGEPKDE